MVSLAHRDQFSYSSILYNDICVVYALYCSSSGFKQNNSKGYAPGLHQLIVKVREHDFSQPSNKNAEKVHSKLLGSVIGA